LKPTENWLQEINKKFRQQDVHPRQRPFRALEEFSKEFNCSVLIPSEIADAIFNWFNKNTTIGSNYIGPLYRGAYYFDSVFWPVYIPIIYGEVELHAFSALETMHENFKAQIKADRMELWNYTSLWVDCLDYAYGFNDLLHDRRFGGLAINFIRSGNKELTGAIAMLLQNRPEVKSVESCRMSIEMFLKAIIIEKVGWNENKLKNKIGHNLKKAGQKVVELTDKKELRKILPEYDFLPDIHERYSGKDWEPKYLWKAYCLAQATATSFTRMYSDRDTRPQVLGK